MKRKFIALTMVFTCFLGITNMSGQRTTTTENTTYIKAEKFLENGLQFKMITRL